MCAAHASLLARARARSLDAHSHVDAIVLRPRDYSRFAVRAPLRAYQAEVADAILASVLHHRGLTFAVLMSRQAGKNETSAHLEALLLMLFRSSGGWLVKASPTFQPQTVNSILRLEAKLENPWTHGRWQRERGYMVRLGQARAAFFSAQPRASVVGATASILLEADEAQDIPEEKWNKDFRPMGASTNVTTVLGTAWTPDTLLARTVRALRKQEAQDGRRRVFVVPWRDVAQQVPAYRAYVEAEIERLGPTHPTIRTQYALEDVDSVSPMFPASRQALMRGDHLAHAAPEPGSVYALTVDVAGQASAGESRPADPDGGDCTACTLFEVRVAGSGEPLAGRPRYSVVGRWWWRGVGQAELYERLTNIIETWTPRRIVVDATGLGAGLASFLSQRFGARVMPFTLTVATKSQLGWAFLGICDTARFRDHALDGSPAQAEFWQQVAAAQYGLLPGPGRRLRWGARPGRGHDDLLVSAALCAVLENEGWGSCESIIIPAPDILDDPDWCVDYPCEELEGYEEHDPDDHRGWRRL